ncbi:NUDIX hydrolase [Serinibacter arcticus]|uniref:NUDIX hydrolase n=1 Tax=Serinibacter arcticus TaxID=1655435 RepID=A0A2U1ZVU9_9MICO|nr:NUDIX hydrolase [Serinibacter arcticus]PWD51116.1 NUDIX hydrolase [Serinibacter arcticus]
MSSPSPAPRAPGRPAPPPVRALRASAGLPVVDETSAGGLVVNVVDGVALCAVIARRNRAGRLEWCLPKGHLEGVETAEQAAVREVAEETGIVSQVVRHLATIDYWFAGHDRRVHKVVHHYLLAALGGELTTENDPDHEAEEVAWVALDELASRLAYPNERRIVAMARDVLVGGS